MTVTISGHNAITTWGDPRLRQANVPGPAANGVWLRTHHAALPLFLNVAKRLSVRVQPLNRGNCWSYSFRPAAMGGGAVSDHAGWAIDLWSGDVSGDGGRGIGAHTWPSRMPEDLARVMGRELDRYRTADGRFVFGWGASRLAPGVVREGPCYRTSAGHDPMHVYIAPGITVADLRAVRRAMRIDRAGNAHPEV